MICPHCSKSLRRRQRSRRRCSACRRTFALEPKENELHLHDLRVRRLAQVLADPVQPGAPPLRYTADQLRLAASRKILAKPKMSRWLGCAGQATFLGVVAVVIGVFAGARGFIAPVYIFGVVAIICLIGYVATVGTRRYRGEPLSAWEFERLMEDWVAVYGAPPQGLIAAGPVADAWPSGPPVALLYCTDPGTSAFLAASGIVERRSVALVGRGVEWPPASLRAAVDAHPALPVFVLHPADPAGCLAASRLRSDLPPGIRVVDAGLRPRVAESAGPPVRLRPDRSQLDELARTGAVDARELSWLAKGNTFPLAALRPARLLMAVERALQERALQEADPEADRAAALGFMAWPERVE